MDEQLNSNQEPQKITPPPVRMPDAAPPNNLPAESNVISGPSELPAKSSSPEIAVRTMESDIKSLSEFKVPKAQSVLPPMMKDVTEVPETVSQLPGEIVSEQPPRSFAKTLLLILGILVIGGGVGFVGYYYVYPLVIGTEMPAVGEAPGTAAPAPVSELPVRINHVSYFKTAVPKNKIEFRTLTLVNIAGALQQIGPGTDGSLNEVAMLHIGGGQIDLADFLSALLPLTDADKNVLSSALERDFTAFLYSDANGVWPGYVAKLKSAADADKLNSDLLPVLELFDLGSFYLASPVNLQPFKDGKYKNFDTRYAVGSTPGASFNYAFAGDYLVLSTSFNGFKAAVMALGL